MGFRSACQHAGILRKSFHYVDFAISRPAAAAGNNFQRPGQVGSDLAAENMDHVIAVGSADLCLAAVQNGHHVVRSVPGWHVFHPSGPDHLISTFSTSFKQTDIAENRILA